MLHFCYCQATEWGRDGGEETEQVETKIQADEILGKFKIMEERWGRSERNESGGGEETIRQRNSRKLAELCSCNKPGRKKKKTFRAKEMARVKVKKPRREGLKQTGDAGKGTEWPDTDPQNNHRRWNNLASAVVTRLLCDYIHSAFTATTHPVCWASRLVCSQFVEGVNLKAAS